METIRFERVLELVASKVLERTKKMPSLAEKQILVDKIREKVWYDEKLHLVTCAAVDRDTIQKDFPQYPFLLLERVYGEYDEEHPEWDDDGLYGWMLYCFHSFDKLREWFRRNVEQDLDIGCIEAIYMLDLNTYKEVPPKYFVEVDGKRFYITPLLYWGFEDDEVEPIYQTIDIELGNVAEVHCGAKVSYHLGHYLEEIYDRLVINELADYACSDNESEEKGYFLFEGQKHPFIFHTKDSRMGVKFFTPKGEEVEDIRSFLRPDRAAEGEV